MWKLSQCAGDCRGCITKLGISINRFISNFNLSRGSAGSHKGEVFEPTMSAIELAFSKVAPKLEESFALLTLKRQADRLKRLPKDPAKAFCYDMLNRVSRYCSPLTK